MAHLHAPRLAFAGRVLTDVPTMNNSAVAYGQDPVLDPGWNPLGGGAFDLLGCTVTGGEHTDGRPVGAGDRELGLAVVGAADRPCAKLVDLDPDWQGSSQIWGLTVRLIDPADGDEVLSGAFAPAAFRDAWRRQADGIGANRMPIGASFTSVLEDVRFGPRRSAYPTLDALADGSGRLAITLNLCGVYYTLHPQRHATGLLTGVIGPARPGEPSGFAAGRRLEAGVLPHPDPRRNLSVGRAVAVVDGARLTVDLGNAYPIADADGEPAALPPGLEALEVGVLPRESTRLGTVLTAADVAVIGPVPLDTLRWHAGIVAFDLTADQRRALAGLPLALLASRADERRVVVSREVRDGRYVRADDFVHRIDAPGRARTTLWAFDRGAPVAAPVHLAVAPGGLLSVPGAGSGVVTVTTGSDGAATVEIDAADPRHPRADVDGQVESIGYAPRLAPDGTLNTAESGLDPNQDLIIAHVRDPFTVPDRPDWARDVQPILAAYTRLYPIMGTHLADLGDLEAIRPWRKALLFALTRDPADPNHMPVTRDLSAARRATIVRFLEQLDEAPTALAREPAAEPVPRPPEDDAKTAIGDAATVRG